MQPLNDDMDNLFRRAAENYPLNISGADWSKVQHALQQQPVTPPVPEEEKKRRYFLFLVLFPLALCCFIGYKYFVHNPTIQQGADQIIPTVSTGAAPRVPFSPLTTPAAITQTSVAKQELRLKSTQQVSKKTATGYQTTKSSFSTNNQQALVTTVKSSSMNTATGDETADKLASNRLSATDPLMSLNGKLQGRSADPLFNSTGLKTASPAYTLVQNRFSSPKRLYAGIVGGIDGTTVKFQKITNVGKDYGFIIGYQLNKKLSIETGLIDEKKYYYSNGEYFSTKNISMPPNSEITKVDGNCRMFEIPVVLKYNLSHYKNGQWFATTGFSSYFMRRESYEYTYYYPATNRSRDYYASYTTKRNSLVSNLQLSAGYTHPLGRVADLRVEPYVKIPLRGVGTGSLPLTSGGIRIGITRKLF